MPLLRHQRAGFIQQGLPVDPRCRHIGKPGVNRRLRGGFPFGDLLGCQLDDVVAQIDRLLPRDHAQRLTLDKERIAHWLKVGAQPSDRVAKFLSQAELMKPRERREQTKKPVPRAKAQERMKAEAAAAAAAAPEASAT